MTQYNKIPLDLTQRQYENLSHSISNLSPLTLRVTQQQIRKGGGDLMLTGRQERHLDKSLAKGKGANLVLSQTQLKKMKALHKKGGYLTDMNKCVAGQGMHGVDDPPEMPRDAGIGAEAQDGAGVKEVVARVGSVAKKGLKIIKPIAKIGLQKGCELGVKALSTKAGVNASNPLVGIAASQGCSAAVNAILGEGVKPKPKLKRTKKSYLNN